MYLNNCLVSNFENSLYWFGKLITFHICGFLYIKYVYIIESAMIHDQIIELLHRFYALVINR